VDQAQYRRVLGHFPTGVTVVTANGPDGPVGLSISSFTAVSLSPPLVGFLPAHTSWSWPMIRAAGWFCVNILAAGQEKIARLFATPGVDRFQDLNWQPAPYSGAPRLEGVVAWIDCEIEAVTVAGDHDFVLGRVHALHAESDEPPLLFHRSRYARGPQWPRDPA